MLLCHTLTLTSTWKSLKRHLVRLLTLDAIEAIHHKLETQLKKSRVEFTVAKKTQAKVEEALVVVNEEVKCLKALLI